MLNSLKKVVQSFRRQEACAGCDPAILASCKEAEAGSVTPHAFHVFVRLAVPSGDHTVPGEAWWPERVDDLSDFAAVDAAIKGAGERIHGKVKVTAFDYLAPREQPAGTCDVLVFPDGLYFQHLPLDKLPSTVTEALAGCSTRRSGGEAPSVAQQARALAGAAAHGTHMFVCCHASRDERCGHVGPPLASSLAQLVEQKGLDGGISVLKTSHVGGHKYAGNLLVFSQGKNYHGDWFGGLRTSNAAAFLDALLACKAPSGAPGDFSLRRWWRGRIGQTKEEQLACFQKALADIEDAGGSVTID